MVASNFQFWFLKHNISIISLHHFTCQIEASGAVTGDCEDEGLWRFPGAEVFFRDGEANGKALGGDERAGGFLGRPDLRL